MLVESAYSDSGRAYELFGSQRTGRVISRYTLTLSDTIANRESCRTVMQYLIMGPKGKFVTGLTSFKGGVVVISHKFRV